MLSKKFGKIKIYHGGVLNTGISGIAMVNRTDSKSIKIPVQCEKTQISHKLDPCVLILVTRVRVSAFLVWFLKKDLKFGSLSSSELKWSEFHISVFRCLLYSFGVRYCDLGGHLGPLKF